MSHRTYQKQYTVAESVDQLRNRSGSSFDPEIVEVFVDVVMANLDKLQPGSTAGAVGEIDDAPEYSRES